MLARLPALRSSKRPNRPPPTTATISIPDCPVRVRAARNFTTRSCANVVFDAVSLLFHARRLLIRCAPSTRLIKSVTVSKVLRRVLG
jgi:hypothetical protein